MMKIMFGFLAPNKAGASDKSRSAIKRFMVRLQSARTHTLCKETAIPYSTRITRLAVNSRPYISRVSASKVWEPFMRLAGKDLLKKKYDKKNNSYWVKRDKPMGTMKRQF